MKPALGFSDSFGGRCSQGRRPVAANLGLYDSTALRLENCRGAPPNATPPNATPGLGFTDWRMGQICPDSPYQSYLHLDLFWQVPLALSLSHLASM